jgi:hypothetical protein
MMELFDKRFVHFMWDDELKGKRCFVSDGIDELRVTVEKAGEYDLRSVIFSRDERAPFQAVDGLYAWKFAYYDPNYEVKKAFSKEKTIQLQISESCWMDISSYSDLLFVCNTGGILRIKPEEEKWIAYLARKSLLGKSCYLTACKEDALEVAQEEFAAKTKLFVGSKKEVLEWYKPRRKFAEVIKAWEDGKTIQVTPEGTNKWVDLDFEPSWDLRDDYREKPECPCDAGVDSKACIGCEQSEDGKPHPFENYHCYGCDKSSKKNYRPYETVHEFIQDYQDRFPTTTPRPCYTLPFIWLRNKNKKDERQLVYCFMDLIIKMDNTYWDMNDLFDRWTYLDGSPVGMVED